MAAWFDSGDLTELFDNSRRNSENWLSSEQNNNKTDNYSNKKTCELKKARKTKENCASASASVCDKNKVKDDLHESCDGFSE